MITNYLRRLAWRRGILAACIGTALIGGCSNPKNAAVPTDLSQMASIKGSVDKLTPEEKELFNGYVMRHTMGAALQSAFGKGAPSDVGIPPNVTIGQAVDEQRAFLANEKAKEAAEKELKEKILAEREKAMDAMRSAVTVTMVSKKLDRRTGYGGVELDRQLVVVIGFKNNTEKAVAGIKGTLDVNDMFGEELSGFAFSYDKTIPPGGTATWTGGRSTKFGMNSAKDEKFAELSDDKYKAIWKPDVIIFGDGTKLAAPEK